MEKELKYIFKGCFLAVIILAIVYFINYCYSYKSPAANPNTTIVINYDKLMNNPTVIAGKTLFQSNCSMCHSLDKIVDGASLEDIEDRVPDKKLLLAWIKNSDEVLKSGDPYFTNLNEKYNRVKMPAFPNLTDKDIRLILDYIKVVSAYRKLPTP